MTATDKEHCVSESILEHGYIAEEHAPDPVTSHGDPTPPGKVAIWLFLARKRADIPAEQTLAQDAGTVGAGDWPAPIIALYLGKTTSESAQKAAASPDPTRQRDQRCEANFYIAQWHLLRGEREAALQLLRNAQSGCPGSIVEHEATVAELRRLAQKP